MLQLIWYQDVNQSIFFINSFRIDLRQFNKIGQQRIRLQVV